MNFKTEFSKLDGPEEEGERSQKIMARLAITYNVRHEFRT